MKTPPLKPLIIASLPASPACSSAATLVWHFDTPKLVMPFVLGIIAGGLVDLDNRLTGRLKNIVITVALFTLSSLLAQSTIGTGVPFILAMTLMTSASPSSAPSASNTAPSLSVRSPSPPTPR